MSSGDQAEALRDERFEQLLGTCQRPVYVYALSLLHNPADADEVVQETNLVLWEKFDQYEPGTNFVRWALSIARYEVLKIHNRRPKRERLFSSELLQSLADSAESLSDDLDPRRATLDGCLTKLSDKDRNLITHRYQSQATTRSLAESLGRSVQGTRRSLHRIRSALLACIERNLPREDRR